MKVKRILSMILAAMIVFTGLPIGELVAWAAEGDPAEVKGVTVTKTYKNLSNIEVMYIEVRGTNLGKLGKNPVIVRDQNGNPSALTTIVENEFRLYYKIDNPLGIAKISVNSGDYNIGEVAMPQISEIKPLNRIVGNDEKLTIEGSGFEGNGLKVNFYNSSGTLDAHDATITGDKITKGFLKNTVGGPYRLEFKYTDPDIDKNFTIEDNYPNLFTVYGELGVSDDITMFPNQGSPDTEVTIAATELTGEMSAFFLKNEDDQYDIKNMGEFTRFIRKGEGSVKDKDRFFVKVPKLEQGAYRVVLTNKVLKGQDPKMAVNSTKTFNNNIFIIISDGNKPSIVEIQPNKGPAAGIPATIRGRYLGSISPNIFEINTGVIPTMVPKQKDEDEVDKEEGDKEEGDKEVVSDALVITYGDGAEVIGRYKTINTENGGVDVLKLERKITGYVGNKLSFREGSELSVKGHDSIEVNVPPATDEEIDPIKDVTLEIETTITYGITVIDDKGIETEKQESIILTETVTKLKGFIFEQLGYEPKVTNIVPDKVPVDLHSDGRYRTSLKDMRIAINGKDFSIYRYETKDNNGKDVVRYKYPIVNIGNQIILDKNKNPEIDLRVFDKNGNEIDGSGGNDLGVKILITIPEKLPKNGLAEGTIGSNTDTWVRNPLRNTNPTDMGSTSNPGVIQFVHIDDAGKIPNITTVTPTTVTTDGEKGIVITGQNFYPNVKVYIDGVEIKNTKRNETGTEIVFDAPAGREGYTQIIVQNEEGGADTYYPFTYVKTYTNPKIIDFNPKKGTADTLVTVTGRNFVPPNPLVKDLRGIGIWKLIGTRVLLGGEDINEYYMAKDEKHPGLQTYTSPANNLVIQRSKRDKLTLSDYYHSIIFQKGEEDDPNKAYYTIFFDTKTGQVKLTDGDKDVYIIDVKGNGFIATRDGEEFDLVVGSTGFKIGEGATEKKLTIKTPYLVEDGKITGNKVKVINNSELIFKVPPMPREGYYDLTVLNPDTKKDSKTGNNGFYYFFQPELKPKIDDIKPNEGSVDGQYYINILGDGFIDMGGDNKTAVIIGAVVVNPKDVEVSPDGKNLKVKVPKYPGDLEKETDMDRKSVAVVVVNPDGGSDSVIDGFSYIIPISHPRIDKLILNKGSAAGGESVIIEGSGFRFFEPFKDSNNNSEWDLDEDYTDVNYNKKWDDLRYWLSDDKKKEYDELAKDYEKNILPILPKIYFDGKEVAIKDFTASTIEVETPKGEKGNIEVYLVNNDHGVSNKVKFNYEASNPKINTIVPNVGRKSGGDKVEVLGQNFHNSKINTIASENTKGELQLPLLQFGNLNDTNISNGQVPIDAPQNSGRIRDRQSTVKVGNLTVKYDASKDIRKLNFTIEEGTGEGKEEYELNNVEYDDSEIFLPVSLLKDKKDGKSYKGYELVRIKLEKIEGAYTTSRLRIDRGFSPEAELVNIGHINVKTPSYYTIGSVLTHLINPDGGIATSDFNYKNPDSKPTITNILRDGGEGYKVDDGRTIVQVNYAGGNTMEVIGTDFRKPVTIKIGDSIVIPHESIEYFPEDESISTRLIFKMPAVDKKHINTYQRLVVENEDGGFAGSEPIYIKFILPESTGLEIMKVTPNFGPTIGGTVVTIEGRDFRNKMDDFPDRELKVYFGSGSKQIRVPKEDIISVEFDKIVLKTPPHTAGTVDIKVENPDGNIVEFINGFTYISRPKITSVVDPDNDRKVINTISAEGGEKIKILGNDFMAGARVMFNPVLRLVEKGEKDTGDVITIGTEKYILESGITGNNIEVVSGQTITVTTPPGKLGDKGVIVINPDKGATNVYNIEYGIPGIDAPLNVVAEVVFDQFIRVHWSGVKDALQYEIYMSKDDGNFEFIGTTELTSFAVQKIESRTKYQFLVRAIGKYGTSKPIDESKSNKITTGRNVGPEDEDGELAENTVIDRNGNLANIVIGSKDFKSDGMTIDLTRGELAGVEDIAIRIPAKIISRTSGGIIIIGKDYRMDFSPEVFKNSTIDDNRNNSEAGVVFKVYTHKENIDVKGGTTIVGGRYMLEGMVYVGKDMTKMDHLNGNLGFVLDPDYPKAQGRRLSNIQTVRYDNSTKTWIPVNYANRLGLYTVIGSRR